MQPLTETQQAQYQKEEGAKANPMSPEQWRSSQPVQPVAQPFNAAPATAPVQAPTYGPVQSGANTTQGPVQAESQVPVQGPVQSQPSPEVPPVMSLLTPEQAKQYYQEQNSATQPVSPTEWKKQKERMTGAMTAMEGKEVPPTGAAAAASLDSYFKDQPPSGMDDSISQFMSAYGGMNPIEANIFQGLSTALSSTFSQQSLKEFYQQEVKAQGIEGLNVELADINKIMEGTEDDIRDEITAAGGFATESQVAAMTGARNKTLLKRANYLSNLLAAKNDYVDRIVSLTQADREQVSKDLDRKLGIGEMMFNMAQTMQKNAKENYTRIIDTVGWDGLMASLKGNDAAIAGAEKVLGLGKGELKTLADFYSPDEEYRDLQMKKLRQELNKGPELQTQVVEIGGKKKLINSKTGAVIADFGGDSDVGTQMQLAGAHSKITEIGDLLKDGYLGTAVGTNFAGRVSPVEWFTGGKSTFVGSMQNLLQSLTLDKLVQAKAQGATFGSLTDGERETIAAAATKLNSPAWTVRDDKGNVLGWRVQEDVFKAEMDKINNFAKLDFILKGGEPTSVGVRQAPDGSLWTKNSDGTVTRLK